MGPNNGGWNLEMLSLILHSEYGGEDFQHGMYTQGNDNASNISLNCL